MTAAATPPSRRLVGDASARVRHVVQGEHKVGDDPDECLVTLLGSCVSACLHDPVAGLGGMNHFLLPGAEAGGRGGESLGVHAMELLVNALLVRGASRSRLVAKLFGGADTMRGLSDVGARNAAFASAFLAREGVHVASECLGGARGRKLQFWPASGRARRSFMAAAAVVTGAGPATSAPASGVLELF